MIAICYNLNLVTFAFMVEWIEAYFSEFFRLLLEMAPWLLLGFTFAGLLHVFMPGGSIRKYMGGRNLKSVSLCRPAGCAAAALLLRSDPDRDFLS